MKNKVKRFIPLLCCVALIAALIVPVSAATSYDPEGEWIFDEQISAPPFTSLSADFVCNISGSEESFVALVYDASTMILSYEAANGNLLNVWTRHSGWANDEYRYIRISLYDGGISDGALWSWFQNNAIQVTDGLNNPFYTTTAYINNVPFAFSALGSSPDVSATVTATGITLTSGFRSKTWTYSGSGTFLGFSYSVDATEPTFQVNSTINFPGSSGADSSYSLFPVPPDDGSGSDPETPPSDDYVIRAGVWRVRKDSQGNFVPPAEWPFTNPLDPFLTFPFLVGTTQIRFVTYSSSAGLIYHPSFPDASQADNLVAYTSASGWSEDCTTIFMQSDRVVEEPLYTWFTSTYEYISDDPNVGIYFTRVLIYNYSGEDLLDQYIVFQDDTAKQLEVSFTSSGLVIVSGPVNVLTYVTGLVGGFEGFSLKPNSGSPDYSSGDSLYIGGSSANATLVLYETFVPPFNDPSDIVLSDFLVNAISGFMDFEIFPGASLSDLLWLVICIGALFVFLRMII